MNKIAVFASGNGSNFEAIVQESLKKDSTYQVVLLVCDHLDAYVTVRACKHNIPVFAFDPKNYADKQSYEQLIVNMCRSYGVQFIALAGYMRLLEKTLLNAYQNKIINIHPSLLPAFKGKNAIEQAIEYGVKVIGVSIHYVNLEMDAGEIIAQECFSTVGLKKEDIEIKIHQIEHQMYPQIINKLLKGEKNEKSVG